MPRTARLPHELKLRNHHGRAVCTYRNVVYPFGAWGDNGPTPDALAAFHRQVGVWTLNPDAGGREQTGEPLAVLWADWLDSPHSPRDRRDENRRCGRAMFGRLDQPGPLLGASVADLTAADVLAWQDRLCAAGLSRYTVKRFVALLRSCLAWGRVAGRVPADVVDQVALVPPPPESATKARCERQAASVWTFGRAVRRITGPSATLLRVEWYTGARPSELCRLKVGDIQRSGVVRPRKGQGVDLGAVGVWGAILDRHKTAGKGGQRCLFFGPRCQRLLAPLLAGRPPDEPVFVSRRQSPYTSRAVNLAVKRACRRTNRSVVTPYQIRHAVAERVQAKFSDLIPGAGYLAAQAYLGHKVRGVTGGYSGADWVTAAKVAATVGCQGRPVAEERSVRHM